MKTSAQGLELIRKAEGLRLSTYRCPAGKLTIGYGHTGTDVKEGIKIDISSAEIMLKADCARFEKAVGELVTIPLLQREFDALVSFCYNLGAGRLKESTLLKKLNAGDRDGAAAQFILWTKSGGREMPGLRIRREGEQALFLGIQQS
jgi:lysozyme